MLCFIFYFTFWYQSFCFAFRFRVCFAFLNIFFVFKYNSQCLAIKLKNRWFEVSFWYGDMHFLKLLFFCFLFHFVLFDILECSQCFYFFVCELKATGCKFTKSTSANKRKSFLLNLSWLLQFTVALTVFRSFSAGLSRMWLSVCVSSFIEWGFHARKKTKCCTNTIVS